MVLTAQQTARAQLTAVPGTPAAQGQTVAPTRPAVSATVQIASSSVAQTPASSGAVTSIPMTETPGLKPLAGGTTYTNPTKTYRIDLPPGWTAPMPDPTMPGRVVTRASPDAVVLAIEEGPAPDDWARLQPPVVASLLDAAYRKSAPGSTLQNVVLTGIRGASDAGLPTYDFTYASSVGNSPSTVERFVTLTFAGAIIVTTTATPDVTAATRPAIEGIVGSLVPLKLDAPTPAALAPPGRTGTVTRTPSGLGIMLPSGWAAIASPAMPPGVEFAAQRASGDQHVRIVHKQIADGTKLNDFAATVAGELKATASNYEVESEGMNTIGGARAVRNLYRATVGGKEVVGQSVALIKGGNGYVISVEAPAAQYDAKPDDAQALFDQIESSITLP
ncbi:MAG: hypothetical protein M3176_02740 [Chloroflexota bacterium]|nr:hypothetical protein [Chloroflexota bacterium]